MSQHDSVSPDYGTGQKKLGIYLIGLVGCSVLTIIAFWMVMTGGYTKWQIFAVIYSCAVVQFIFQLICFLRLNLQTEQSRTNVMSLIFTGVILTTIIIGSLWIMSNVNYNMMM